MSGLLFPIFKSKLFYKLFYKMYVFCEVPVREQHGRQKRADSSQVDNNVKPLTLNTRTQMKKIGYKGAFILKENRVTLQI